MCLVNAKLNQSANSQTTVENSNSILRPLAQVVASPSAFDSFKNYIGQTEFDGWFCVLTQTRDSGCLERSNFRSALEKLGGESDSVVVHRFGHWACGWWEALAVKEGTAEFTAAEKIAEKLEDYPVVDEEDFSNLEQEEASDMWRNCFNDKERIKYIREHRSQFEFHNLADMLGCVRGKYFAGYASELLN